MKEKYYDSTSSLLIGIIFIGLGIVLLIGKEQLYCYMIDIMVFVFLARTFLNIVRFFFRKQSLKESRWNVISTFFHLVICLVFVFIPSFSIGIIPFIFASYLLAIGLSQFVMCFICIINGEFLKVTQVLMGLVYLGIALPIFFSPVSKLDVFLKCFSFYVLLLGGTFVYDFIANILSLKTRNRLKRKIRVTLPKVVEAVIPYAVMREINRNLDVKKNYCYSYCYDKRNETSDLEILIHTSNRGFNRMGHIDIYFEGKVMSYGNYDEGSRFCRDVFGDGVLFVTDKKEEYINFCIDNSKKTIFDFGIKLTERQKKQVRKRIDELLSNTTFWDYKSDKKYNHGRSYAAKLYRKTGATFYKFKKGKYKLYFILGTNCCFLVDDVVGNSGMDILSINGVITPGTYYDFLNRELNLKNSNVISKEIYNFERRFK